MKKLNFRCYFSVIFILKMTSVFALNGQGLAARDSVRIERAEIKVERALAAHQRHESRVLEGDSLIQVGFAINDSAVAKIDSLSLEMQKRLDEYNNKERQLRRQIRSGNDAESRKASNAMRELEREHRAGVREDDALIRTWLRNATQGARMVERGEKMKKAAYKAMRSTQRNLNRAKKEHADLLQKMNLAPMYSVR